MSIDIGRKTWAIPEGYIPAWSRGPEPGFTSHEAFCILNAVDQDAMTPAISMTNNLSFH